MERYKHDMKVAANKRYIIFGMTGCLCFGIGDWLLGYVEPTLIGGDVFYFIRAGHGADYFTFPRLQMAKKQSARLSTPADYAASAG